MQPEQLAFRPAHRRCSGSEGCDYFCSRLCLLSVAVSERSPRDVSSALPWETELSRVLSPGWSLHPQSLRVKEATHGWGQLLVPLAARERSRDGHSPKSQVIFHFTRQ